MERNSINKINRHYVQVDYALCSLFICNFSLNWESVLFLKHFLKWSLIFYLSYITRKSLASFNRRLDTTDHIKQMITATGFYWKSIFTNMWNFWILSFVSYFPKLQKNMFINIFCVFFTLSLVMPSAASDCIQSNSNICIPLGYDSSIPNPNKSIPLIVHVSLTLSVWTMILIWFRHIIKWLAICTFSKCKGFVVFTIKFLTLIQQILHSNAFYKVSIAIFNNIDNCCLEKLGDIQNLQNTQGWKVKCLSWEQKWPLRDPFQSN